MELDASIGKHEDVKIKSFFCSFLRFSWCIVDVSYWHPFTSGWDFCLSQDKPQPNPVPKFSQVDWDNRELHANKSEVGILTP